MIRTSLAVVFLVILSTNTAHSQVIVSPGPPETPENWIRFTVDLPELEWYHFDANGQPIPGLKSARPIIVHGIAPNIRENGVALNDDTFWISKTLLGRKSLSFQFRDNIQMGVENMRQVPLAPEFDSGLNEFHLTVGPITSIEWDAQVSLARRILTFTGAGGYVRVVPEPSTLALVACAAFGAYRRRR